MRDLRASSLCGGGPASVHDAPRAAPTTDEEARLWAWLRKSSTDRPCWAMATSSDCSTKAGWVINNKRVRQLWRDEGLRVPQRRKKERLTGPRSGRCPRTVRI
ncbi:transposase [Mycolicibacterium fortuitum]|nr:transposase [Mycolicibacterium fortuitum]